MNEAINIRTKALRYQDNAARYHALARDWMDHSESCTKDVDRWYAYSQAIIAQEAGKLEGENARFATECLRQLER